MGEAEVLVVGGGPAGLGAAIGAAEAGADVILVERHGYLGGNATAALVMPFTSYHTQRPAPQRAGAATLCPTDHGPGEPAIGGVLQRLVHRLVQEGGAIAPAANNGYVVPFDPEIFKLVTLKLLDEAGVKFLFHAFATDVLNGDRDRGVLFETKSGPGIIKAQVMIDCTGDGDIAARAGARYEVGREDDGLVEPMTLMFLMAEFEREKFEEYVEEHPEEWYGVHGLWDLIRQATVDGELNLPREDILLFGTIHQSQVAVNSTRVTKVLGTDVWDLTYAEYEGRRQLREVARFLQRYVPGFARSYVVQSGFSTGVRESRRITGEYKLTEEDVLQARKFEDVIARGPYPIDIHHPKGKGTTMKRLPPDEAYDIPLRCLLPKGVDNLLVAGRCISGSYEAHASYRVMPISIATGQGAGVCAALAARERIKPGAVNAGEVQTELLRQGANLGRLNSHGTRQKPA
ncbi:MAG: FAD-dependent oxidoreductase [Dehalococcoidia bacterium]|nr:FAD-dependent oxidoreductase [Dehalococcoidia bacterium]